jgi:hypothetical protein
MYSEANIQTSGKVIALNSDTSEVTAMMISGLVAAFLIFGLFLAMLSSSPKTPR